MVKGILNAIIQESNAQLPLDTLYLRDGESAHIRFLTKIGEGVQADCHRMRSDTGRRWIWKLCPGESLCIYCQKGNRPTISMFFLVFVYSINHTPYSANRNPMSKQWTALQENGQTFYKETVCRPMILRVGIGKNAVMRKRLVDMSQKFDDLTDRDYIFRRTGSELVDTEYTFEPRNPSPMPPELTALKDALPCMTDIVTNEDHHTG
ncbi:MAG: hypothetical protein QUS07_07045 [Methanothrix sp.]|nr:hypothetical protein [Methanothrix sp.]